MQITEVHDDGKYLSVSYKNHRINVPTSLSIDETDSFVVKAKGKLLVSDSWFITYLVVTNQHFYKLGKQLARM